MYKRQALLTDPSDKAKVYARIVSGAFLVGARDFTPESAGETNSLAVKLPSRPADRVARYQTAPNQTQLYRLSGDYNPLHVDPTFAQMSGFQEPILHGLCSAGVTARLALREYGGNSAANFKAFRCRFAAPVLPGETLEVQMWQEGKRIVLQVLAKERELVVINNAFLDLHEVQVSQPSKL